MEVSELWAHDSKNASTIWNPLDNPGGPIGQGATRWVTPVQLATYAAIIANLGELVIVPTLSRRLVYPYTG